jgi:hypothetical protein
MDKIHKFSLHLVILVASIILGCFYYAVEINKQKSIQKQNEVRLEEEKTSANLKAEQENQNKLLLQLCLDKAHDKYIKSAQYWLDFESKIGSSNVVEEVNKEKLVERQDKDECFKQYK